MEGVSVLATVKMDGRAVMEVPSVPTTVNNTLAVQH